jgi:Fe-S cluster biogenesis protein NfuA
MPERTATDICKDIEHALDVVREALATHGGDIEYVDFDAASGCLLVRFSGMCVGCPMAEFTLHGIVENIVCGAVPDVREVRSA